MRPSWIEVDLAAIRHNVAAILTEVAPAMLCAVVKADAYGHGDVPVAQAAVTSGAEWLAVALPAEGVRLREAGIDVPILLLSEPDPSDIGTVLEWQLTPSVYRAGFVDSLEGVASTKVPVHLVVDTGMHRVGASPADAVALARRIDRSDVVTLGGAWSHFPSAEDDLEFTKAQIRTMTEFAVAMRNAGVEIPLIHTANTPGALGYPAARFDMVRVGLGIYGLRPLPGYAEHVELRPAMRVVSHVSHVQFLPAGVRPSYGRIRPLAAAGTVATVPIGYADGVSRRLGHVGGEVLIRGRRYPFAGNVTMDQMMVDVGSDPVEIGDEVVLIGRQGDAEVTADEWAERLGTINYEIVCSFGVRLPRRFSE